MVGGGISGLLIDSGITININGGESAIGATGLSGIINLNSGTLDLGGAIHASQHLRRTLYPR